MERDTEASPELQHQHRTSPHCGWPVLPADYEGSRNEGLSTTSIRTPTERSTDLPGAAVREMSVYIGGCIVAILMSYVPGTLASFFRWIP